MRLPRTAAATLALVLAAGLPVALVTPAAAGSAAAPTSARSADPVGGPLLGTDQRVVRPGPDAQKMPKVYATTWVLADADTGEVLAAKGAHVQRPPASTLKTLTALTLLPRLDPEQVYTATYQDASVEGSHVGIVPDATYTVHDLWNGLFLQSGNDAASALANANGGWKKSLRQMNEQARLLQAYDTYAVNPSGLDEPDQVSSAYDLALISRAGLQREDFAAYASTIEADFPGRMPKKPGKKRPTYKIYTQNRLLLHGFDGAIGVKTGYTTNAGRTYVGAATRDGRTLIVTLMQITEPTEDAAAKLLDWGFANADKVTPVGVLVDPVDPDAPPSDPSQGTVAPAAGGGDVAVAAGPGSVGTSVTGGVPGWLWALVLGLAVLAAVAALRVRAAARVRDLEQERRQSGTFPPIG